MRNWLINLVGGVTPAHLESVLNELRAARHRQAFLEGQVSGLHTRAEISNEITAGILNGKFSDAEALGIMFASQDDQFQASFFNGAGKAWKSFKPTSEHSSSNEFAQDMQVHYIVDLLDEDGKALVRRFANRTSEDEA